MRLTYENVEDLEINLPGDLRVRSYSGRGMYGKYCAAIVGDSVAEITAGIAATAEPEVALELLKGFRTDSMGKGAVVYWPHIKCEDNED